MICADFALIYPHYASNTPKNPQKAKLKDSESHKVTIHKILSIKMIGFTIQ